MTAYYNEFDPFAAQWLRNLVAAKLIAPGEVDDRSISDIKPSELVGYTQCHFFAGIGGWSLALRLAGWSDDRPVWTGSCPCQPFSNAGAGGGTSDERHLWPHWFHLIRVVKPPVIFGEQVEEAIKYGWLDLVQDDLEGEAYAFASVGLPAGGIGAPHLRQRLWFVADRSLTGREARGSDGVRVEPRSEQGPSARQGGASSVGLAHHHQGLEGHGLLVGAATQLPEYGSPFPSWLGIPQSQQRDGSGDQGSGRGQPTNPGHWVNCDWLPCSDGKWRPVESGTFPLADGVWNRVGLLRGYGNAIVPQVAAEVIQAYMECRP